MKLQGGMSNQIFQWAYGKFLSIKHNTPVFLDPTYYEKQKNGIRRKISLNKFPNISYDMMPGNKNIFSWTNENGKKKIVEVGDNFFYKELNYREDSHYYMSGYWQSEKYFKSIETLIRENLKPSVNIVEKLRNKYPMDLSLSMHIRRTDYAAYGDQYPIQGVEYYKKAVDLIGDYKNLLVFSDDMNWCKENLKFDNMIFVENNDDIEDMWLMSFCENNIMANSTFSWWGSWLNNNTIKKVIAPTVWFGKSANLNYSDIVPEGWIKI
jgi:hypothetical protein